MDILKEKEKEKLVNIDENESKALSRERKELQRKNLLPKFMATGGWQLFKGKYLSEAEKLNPKLRYETISKTLAKHIDGILPVFEGMTSWEDSFIEQLWAGDVSLSTPVLANTGTEKGLPVSCSGGYVGDSVEDFYSALFDNAILTKHGFGTSGYFGDIRPRGSKFGSDGKATGSVPVFESFVEMSKKISQGSQRRGAFAGYFDLMGNDFDEVVASLRNTDDDKNIGFCIYNEDLEAWANGDIEVNRRIAKAVALAVDIGKGYLYKADLANDLLPIYYKNAGLRSYASNLCTEINLGINKDLIFTCVLLSINLANWDKIKGTNKIKIATIMLDCVAEEFIQRAKGIKGLEKAVAFTEKARALGVGVCGFHSYLQKKMVPFESFDAVLLNGAIFKEIEEQTIEASKYLAKYFGECELTKGYGVRNASLRAIAPTKSTALIMGGVSEGINPYPQNIYTQKTPSGEIVRINPELLALMKSKKIHTEQNIEAIKNAGGSIQELDFFTEIEKKVFRTAFEIDQRVVIRLAEQRQKYLDQLQSLNLFFAGTDNEEYICECHNLFLQSKSLVSRYYVNGIRGKGVHYKIKQGKDCEACS